MSKVIIRWRSLLTGQEGHGEPLDRAIGAAWVAGLNRDLPQIFHWLEEAAHA